MIQVQTDEETGRQINTHTQTHTHIHTPKASEVERSALVFHPSSPTYPLRRRISMASCLLLSKKLFCIVRCTERAPSLNFPTYERHSASRDQTYPLTTKHDQNRMIRTAYIGLLKIHSPLAGEG